MSSPNHSSSHPRLLSYTSTSYATLSESTLSPLQTEPSPTSQSISNLTISSVPHSPSSLSQSTVTRHHLYVLALGCLLVYGNYHCYDLPAALNIPLRFLLGSEYGLFQWQLNMLYTVYSAPNILMPLLGGILFDRLGPKVMLISFSALIVMGSLLFWLGLVLRSFPLLLLGRIISGIGGESLEVAGTAITTAWFQSAGYLSLALGINLSTSRIAAAAQDSITPWIVTHAPVFDLNPPWWAPLVTGPALAAALGASFCGLSIAAAYVLLVIDTPSSRAEAGISNVTSVPLLLPLPDKLHSPLPRPHSPNSLTSSSNLSYMNSETPTFLNTSLTSSESKERDTLLRKGVHEPLLSPHYLTLTVPKSPTKSERSIDAVSIYTSVSGYPVMARHHHETVEDETMPLLATSSPNINMNRLGLSFWLLCALTILLYGSVMPFIHISSDFIQSKWYPGDLPKAGALMSLPDLLCAILTPVLGLVVDKLGYPARYLPVSGIFLVLAYVILFYTTFPPAIGLFILGVASAVFAATLWPCVPLLVPDRALATAYGAVTVALNAALAGVPLMVAALNGSIQEDGGIAHWTRVGALFVALSVVATIVAVILLVLDVTNGSGVLWYSQVMKKTNSVEPSVDENGFITVESVVSSPQRGIAVDINIHHRPRYMRSGRQGTEEEEESEATIAVRSLREG